MLVSAIRRANALAINQRTAEETVRRLFIDRYGVDFSDADCDPLIDACSGQGDVYNTLKELDAMVKSYCDLIPIENRKS